MLLNGHGAPVSDRRALAYFALSDLSSVSNELQTSTSGCSINFRLGFFVEGVDNFELRSTQRRIDRKLGASC
jgi:hypothetical protein